MPINFIPNDPLVAVPPPRSVAARPDRPASRAGFVVGGVEPAARYAVGTSGFVRWQARQAAILALETWEKVLGTSLSSWSTGVADPKRLALEPDAGEDLNAYYDRASVSFFHYPVPGSTVFSGASTDVVAHEVGHGVLDAVRPALWSSNYLEVGGFHEAFGDVTAILVALSDRRTRVALLAASPDLGSANTVEATAEDLSNAVRLVLGPKHPAALPRRALNTFQWQLPDTMPLNGGPTVMIAEVHSLARIMSGCFWDTLRAIFGAGKSKTERALWRAAVIAGRLFHEGARTAPITPRFFQSVGRSMVLADDSSYAGAHRAIISAAFGQHNIALGSSAMLAPELSLDGPAPTGSGAKVHARSLIDLRHLLTLGRSVNLTARAAGLGRGVAAVSYQTRVALDGLDPRLAGVSALADVDVLVGGSGGHAAILAAAPRTDHGADAVRRFVASLLANDQIDLDAAPTKSAVRGTKAKTAAHAPVTHRVVTKGGSRSLQRVAFSCACGGHGPVDAQMAE